MTVSSAYGSNITVTEQDFTITGINVPSDADIAILVFNGYMDGVDAPFDVANFDADANQYFTEIITEDDGDEATTAAYSLRYGESGFPTRGATNLTLTGSLRSNAEYDNNRVTLFFLSGFDISSSYIIGTDSALDFADWQSADLGDVGINDIGIIVVTGWTQTVDAAPTGSGQTSLSEGNNGSVNWGIGFELGEDQPEVEVVGNQYNVGIAFAIKASVGTVCWGDDDATEVNIRDFTGNITAGSGYRVRSYVSGGERVELESGGYYELETWNFGVMLCQINVDKYQLGSGDYIVYYKNGNSEANCDLDSWNLYSTPFACAGWIKIKIQQGSI